MFKWNAADMRLLKQPYNKYEDRFQEESEVSRKDKIEFIDELSDGMMSYLLDLYEKFKKDKPSLPHDEYGTVKTVSLKAWVNRNDERHIIETRYAKDVGIIKSGNYFPQRRIWGFNQKGAYDQIADYVGETFHRVLVDCRVKELEYFKSHDEYSILMNKFQNELRNGKARTFGLIISHGTEGVFIYDSDKCSNKRRLTLDELKTLINFNEQLDEFARTLAENNPIKFETPIGKIKKEKEIYIG